MRRISRSDLVLVKRSQYDTDVSQSVSSMIWLCRGKRVYLERDISSDIVRKDNIG
jgi:hypothetical protein